MRTKQHSSRGQRKVVATRYDSEDEDMAPRSVVPSISFNTENGTNNSISSSLSGSCKRRPVDKQKASSPRPRRIRDDIIIADDSPALFAPNSATAMVLSNKSPTAFLAASQKAKQQAALRQQSSTMTTTTTTTTTVTKTTLCLEPTSSSSFSSGCLLSPSNVGVKSTRGQEQLVTRPDRRQVNARDDVGDDSEDEQEEYKTSSLSPKRNTSSSLRPNYRMRTTAFDDDNASNSSSKNSSSVDSSINKHPKKWRVVDINKHNNNIHYSSTASMPRTLSSRGFSSLADSNNSSRSRQTTPTSRTMSSIQLLNQERVRAAEMRTARMRAMMHENMIRPNAFRGFSSRNKMDNKVAAAAAAAAAAAVNKSTAAPVKPCRVKSSEGGQKPMCPVNNTTENTTTIAPKSRQVASTSSKTTLTLSPRGVNRHPSSNSKVMAADLGKRHARLRRHMSVSEEEASDIDSLVQEEEYITEEECVSSEDEYTEEEVLVSEEEEDEEEQQQEQKQESPQQLRRVGRWGERQQKSWKCGATTRTRESTSDPSVDVTEDITENTTQYDSEDEQVDAVVKEEKYEPYFPQFDELMRTRQYSRRAKDQIKLSPGAMSLKDRLAMFQGNK